MRIEIIFRKFWKFLFNVSKKFGQKTSKAQRKLKFSEKNVANENISKGVGLSKNLTFGNFVQVFGDWG